MKRKINEFEFNAIKNLDKSGLIPKTEIANIFGVSLATLANIRAAKNLKVYRRTLVDRTKKYRKLYGANNEDERVRITIAFDSDEQGFAKMNFVENMLHFAGIDYLKENE